MSQANILADIRNIVSAVSGIGVVYDYERAYLSSTEWLTAMTSGGQINGWTISRKKTSSKWEYETTNRLRHVFRIRGYYGVDDTNASEKTFQNLVDSVRQAFNGHETLSGDALVSGPAKVQFVGIREVPRDSGYYVHAAELFLIVKERETK